MAFVVWTKEDDRNGCVGNECVVRISWRGFLILSIPAQACTDPGHVFVIMIMIP